MFAYCGNNPINKDDQNGNLPKWIKAPIKWFAKKVLNPAFSSIKRYWARYTTGTSSRGYTIGGAFGLSLSISFGFTSDRNGDVGAILTINYLGGGTPSAFAGKYINTTDAPNIYLQRGPSTQVGGSVDVLGVAVGAEHVFFEDAETYAKYHGNTLVAGIGPPIPVEMHGETGYSWVAGFNIFDSWEKVYTIIMQW